MDFMKGRVVFIKKLRKKGIIEKLNPKNENEYIIYFYDDKNGNKLTFISLKKNEFEFDEIKPINTLNNLNLDENYYYIYPNMENKQGDIKFVLLKSNHILAKIVKMNPIYTDEFVVAYYINNKYYYKSVTKKDLLPIKNYDAIKDRNNFINRLLND